MSLILVFSLALCLVIHRDYHHHHYHQQQLEYTLHKSLSCLMSHIPHSALAMPDELLNASQSRQALNCAHLLSLSISNLMAPRTSNNSRDRFLTCDLVAYRLIVQQVVTGLATLQNAVQDLSRSYIAHTNTVLGRPLGTPLSLPPLDENAILNLAHSSSADASQSKAIKQEKKEKKEKKKRERDPNMPKRPLTAYFLYMKTARPIIAKDLPKATPGQIAEEGTRRWGEMDEEEKKVGLTTCQRFCQPQAGRH